MAHPKLATVVQRSLLLASTAALVAGPLAVGGSAQSLETVTDTTARAVEDPTCEEALESEDLLAIAEFCEPEEIPEAIVGAVEKATEEAEEEAEEEARKAESGAKEATDEVVPKDDEDEKEGGGNGGGGGAGPAEEVLPPATGGGEPAPMSREVQTSERERPRGISDDSRGAKADREQTQNAPGWQADGWNWSGMRSNSELTLQPFAAPLVTGPPVYDLPQIAQQLFGLDEPATVTAGDPLVAGSTNTSEAGPYTPAGFTSTSPDPTGWLAATATGLIMLVGAGHALNGGRTPKRRTA